MRSLLYRHLQISCVGFIGVAIGMAVGSHFVKVPQVVRPPVHRVGNAEAAIDRVIAEVDLEGIPFNEAVERVRKLSPVPVVVQTRERQQRIASLLGELREPGPPLAPTPPSRDLVVWNDALKKYISADPSVGDVALRRRVAEVQFHSVPLGQAVPMLAALAHADLVVDWEAFDLVGVHEATPVSMRLHEVILAQALRGLLEAAGAGQLAVGVEGGCLILGLPKNDAYEPATRVYDIRDWLGAEVGPPVPENAGNPADADARYIEFVDRLINVLQSTVAPGSWKELGGKLASVNELNGRLIVKQTWENQEQVADLLSALRTDPSKVRLAPATAAATQP